MTEDINNIDEPGFMDRTRLEPEKISFKGKDKLRKEIIDLPESQVEFLSVAYLENEISQEELAELNQCIELEGKNRIIFQEIQKTKLSPPAITYKHKGSLKKLTAGQRTLRIFTTGLSIAATIAILIAGYIFIPDLINSRNPVQVAETGQPAELPEAVIPQRNPIIALAEDLPAPKIRLVKSVHEKKSAPEAAADTSARVFIKNEEPVFAAIVTSSPGISFQTAPTFLIASNNNFTIKETDEDRSRLGKFIASTFREKILGEKDHSDEPLRPFEFALAGVGGLNRLFVWNMELKETLDDTGEPESVYFSSALLTFNAPVRKNDEDR